MTGDDRRPATFGAIVDAALAAWAARWPLYLGLAALSVTVQFVLDTLFRFDPIALTVILGIADGFPTTIASIDVAARMRDEPLALRDLLRAAALRWPLVSIVLIVIVLIEAPAQLAIFGTGDETLYGLLILPGLAALGILSLPSAVTSIDTTTPLIALPGFSLLRSFIVAVVWPNLARLVLGGAMVAVPLMIQQLLEHWLAARGFPSGPATFWANVPVDAIQLAPFQAFFTYLYLDFLMREKR